MCRCTCNWPVYSDHYVVVQCPQCGKQIECNGLPPKPAQLVRKQEWPRWAKLIALRQQPEDKGVGDTFARIAARFGGERIKRISKRIGMPCGCTQRQEEWNRLYAYDNPSDDA